MMRRRALVMAWTCAALGASACGDDGRDGLRATDTPTTTASREPDAGVPDCYAAPTTHLELINACTTAERVTKLPTLPLLLSDGRLPPLP